MLQLITNEIYMTIKLTVAFWKWGNDCVKEKEKRKWGFFISFSDVWIDREVSNYTSPFPYFHQLPCNQTRLTSLNIDTKDWLSKYKGQEVEIWKLVEDDSISTLKIWRPVRNALSFGRFLTHLMDMQEIFLK